MTLPEYKEFYSSINIATSTYDCRTIKKISEDLDKLKSNSSNVKLLKAQIHLKTSCRYDEEHIYKPDAKYGAQLLSEMLMNEVSGEAIKLLRSLNEIERLNINYAPRKVGDYLLKAFVEGKDAEGIHQAYWMLLLGDSFLPLDKEKDPTYNYPSSDEMRRQSVEKLVELKHPFGFETLGTFQVSARAAELGQFDIKQAFDNLKQGANLGSVKSAKELARFYQSSWLMTKANYVKALKYRSFEDEPSYFDDPLLEGYEKMLNCNEMAKLKLFGFKLACTKRSELRAYLKDKGAFARREDEAYLADIYSSGKVFEHTTKMTALYTHGGELAKITFDIDPDKYSYFLQLVNDMTGESKEGYKGHDTWWHPEIETGLKVHLSANTLEFQNSLQMSELEWSWELQKHEKASKSVQTN